MVYIHIVQRRSNERKHTMKSTTAALAAVTETTDLMAEFKSNFETVMHSTSVDEVKGNLRTARIIQGILEERGFFYQCDDEFNVTGFEFRF